MVSLGTERMLVEFGKANLVQKARQQPDKVRQVLDKIKSDGLLPTLEAVFKRMDEPLLWVGRPFRTFCSGLDENPGRFCR
jgi:hypothetical protein